MDPLHLLARWGLALVFATVLLEHAGLPIPAPPLLIAAGSLAAEGTMHAELVLLCAFAACLAADHAWFFGGRRFGRRLLGWLCRLSLSPDSCVRSTDDLIVRHGAALLLVKSFIPGISVVAIPTAAAMGLSYRRFLAFDALGTLGWCGAYLALGMIFRREVGVALAVLDELGAWALAVVGAAFALYLAWKARNRARLSQLYRTTRITPEEMQALLANDPKLIVLDARSRLALEADPRRIPGSIAVEGDAFAFLPDDARDRTLVTFCTCPNEASAALLADRLLKAGYSRVRVLAGGAAALEVLAE